jgi:phosphomannomutase/phosphoglucomutase
MRITQTIFREYDIRGIVGRDLTSDGARLIGEAYAELMRERGVSGAVVVSRDNRPSGVELAAAVTAGLRSRGVDVVDIGVVPTPLNYWAQHHLPVVGGIRVTGSHNPPEYNGLKLTLQRASIHGADIRKLHQMIESAPDTQNTGEGDGDYIHEDVIERYIADIVERAGSLERPMRIVFDCGNGVASVRSHDHRNRRGQCEAFCCSPQPGGCRKGWPGRKASRPQRRRF